jgi:hypothetical protein
MKRKAKKAKTEAKLPVNPYAALLTPMAIVPDGATEPVLADAGSIVKLMDQKNLYRDRISPITRRADELLVTFGAPKKQMLGWITQRIAPDAMKPVRGPTFLVRTKDEASLSKWDAMRFLVAKARKRNPSLWLGPWLLENGSSSPRLLREVIRFFGGKVGKSQDDASVLTQQLFQLIFNMELDVATIKSSPKTKKAKATKTAKAEKPTKKAKASKNGTKPTGKKAGPPPSDRAKDDFVIKRLTEKGHSPFREGTAKESQWKMIRKGMTVADLVAAGGKRGDVNWYIKKGWVKLLRPKSGAAEA